MASLGPKIPGGHPELSQHEGLMYLERRNPQEYTRSDRGPLGARPVMHALSW